MYNFFTFPLEVTDDNKEMLAEIEESATKLCNQEIPALPYSLYKVFSETGSRVEFEEVYMQRRKMLCAFCAMALLDKKGEWLARLSDVIWAICDEFSWALPAHLVRCTEVCDKAVHIDLFASETAFALAEIRYLLADKLPAEVSERIECELKRRIVEPYIRKKPKFGVNNWSAVCASGVVSTLIYLGLDKEFEAVKEDLFSNISDFLSSFPDDGCCLEGSLYWFYGFSHFCYAAELIFEYTKGKVNYFADEKVKKIAFFINNIYLDENFVIPFSDSPHTYSYNPGILCLLSKKYDGIAIPAKKYVEKFENSARYRFATFLRNLYWSKDLPDQTIGVGGYVLYPESGWYINKSNSYIFAAKAGHNDEPHNHNDVGSFIVFDNGKFILDDAGWAKYDGDYFKPEKRYSGTTCTTSKGHSLPIINGKAQGFGSEFCGKILTCDEKSFSIEYADAYKIDGVSSLTRDFFLENKRVTLVEKLEGKCKSLVCRFTTRIKPELSDGKVLIDSFHLSCNTDCKTSISHYDFEPRFAGFGTEDNGMQRTYMIDFCFDGAGEYTFVLEKQNL